MIDVKRKKCVIYTLKTSKFQLSKWNKKLYCTDCKICGMIDINHKPCINCDLTFAHKKNNKHCALCFINSFPNDPKSIKARTSKEFKVVIHTLNKYQNWIYNKPF